MSQVNRLVHNTARLVLTIEPLLLLVVVVAFWTPNMERLHTLWLVILIIAARWIITKRIAAPSPINVLIVGLLVLCAVNLLFAPLNWGGVWNGGWIIGRILMGITLALSVGDRAYRLGMLGVHQAITVTVIVGILLGLAALSWSMWTEKSTQLIGLISMLPTRPTDEWFRNAIGGFNVNEVGGAISFVLPVAAGVAIIDWRTPLSTQNRWLILRRGLASVAFVLLAYALFLGQSRMAIAGCLIALFGLTFILIPRGRWRLLALCGLFAFTAIELIIFTQLTNPRGEVLLERDESSVTSRVQIWTAAANIIHDYPLTGIGMNQFRSRAARANYPVPGYENRVLPHAHNGILQIGADFGIPGMVMLIGLYGTAGWMLWRVWKTARHDLTAQTAKAFAPAVAAGLLAHSVFALADAITLFDRFIFIFWWLIGLTIALYVCREHITKTNDSQTSK